VVGGRIKATCTRCGKTAYLEIAQGSRLRIYRCTCGKSSSYKINFRKEKRETTYGPARAIMANAQEKKILLCDVSTSGISFIITSESALSMSPGQEIGIKFRTGGSSMLQRKIRIKNIRRNRVGAQYVRLGTSL
jgi:hypothetical protein